MIKEKTMLLIHPNVGHTEFKKGLVVLHFLIWVQGLNFADITSVERRVVWNLQKQN